MIYLINFYQQQSGFPSLLPLQPGDALQWETAWRIQRQTWCPVLRSAFPICTGSRSLLSGHHVSEQLQRGRNIGKVNKCFRTGGEVALKDQQPQQNEIIEITSLGLKWTFFVTIFSWKLNNSTIFYMFSVFGLPGFFIFCIVQTQNSLNLKGQTYQDV